MCINVGINGLTKSTGWLSNEVGWHKIFLRTEQDQLDRDGPINFLRARIEWFVIM